MRLLFVIYSLIYLFLFFFIFVVEFAVVTFLFVLVLIYFPDKPPLPPSKSAKRKRDDFFAGAKQILK